MDQEFICNTLGRQTFGHEVVVAVAQLARELRRQGIVQLIQHRLPVARVGLGHGSPIEVFSHVAPQHTDVGERLLCVRVRRHPSYLTVR